VVRGESRLPGVGLRSVGHNRLMNVGLRVRLIRVNAFGDDRSEPAAREALVGAPATTGDLVRHPCIKLHAMSTWPFMRDGELDRVRVSGPLSASTVDAVRAACIAGAGIAMMTYWDVHKLIEREELKRIELADVKPLEIGIWAVFPTRRHMPVRVRAFINALRDRLLVGTAAGSHA